MLRDLNSPERLPLSTDLRPAMLIVYDGLTQLSPRSNLAAGDQADLAELAIQRQRVPDSLSDTLELLQEKCRSEQEAWTIQTEPTDLASLS